MKGSLGLKPLARRFPHRTLVSGLNYDFKHFRQIVSELQIFQSDHVRDFRGAATNRAKCVLERQFEGNLIPA
jgi:hypothetical protein